MPTISLIKKHYKSTFTEMIMYHYDEPVTTGTIYSDTSAIDDGFTCYQLFVGTKLLVSDVYSMKIISSL